MIQFEMDLIHSLIFQHFPRFFSAVRPYRVSRLEHLVVPKHSLPLSGSFSFSCFCFALFFLSLNDKQTRQQAATEQVHARP